MNPSQIKKEYMDKVCRICAKDYTTKFHGKLFESFGINCHEMCAVSICFNKKKIGFACAY